MKNQLNAKVKSVKYINKNLMVLKICQEKKVFEFKPGQFATIGLRINEKIIKRAYSIASKSKDIELEFFISRVQNGILTKKLFNLKKGGSVWLSSRISGFFTLEPVDEKNLILIATGTGICPYLSMLRTYPNLKNKTIALLHGVRNSLDFGYFNELKSFDSKNFKFFPVVSRKDELWKGLKGRVQDILLSDKYKSFTKRFNSNNSAVMLCGNPHMVENLTHEFLNLGFCKHSRSKKGNLHLEKYWSK